MTDIPVENTTASVIAFRDARWKTRWIVVGLSVLLMWRAIGLIDRDQLAQIPFWLLLLVTGLLPEIYLLLYPIFTREPDRGGKLGIPAFSRCLVEFGIAVPVVFGTLFILGAVNALLGYLLPGTSLTPDSVRNLADSPDYVTVFSMLFFAFTFVPVAEEVFFRGFLQNAFRTRMPVSLAAILQSLIFGIVHFYGAMHIGVVVVIGLVLTAVYEWRKTLITPVFVHAGINFMAAVGTAALMIVNANSPVIGILHDPDNTQQCVIRELVPDYPAERAGLQVGDVITSFDGEPIHDFQQLVKEIRRHHPGDSVPVIINRSGTESEVTLVLRRRGDMQR